ncbi:MAG TPA: tRNA-uridine aminocarboxypropyltransferase [Lacunisphaera sp.]
MCYRCFWPKSLCWCPTLIPMPTRTRFLFLMSPKEFKIEKSNTGRLTHLCLPNSELHMGTEYDRDEAVQAVLNDPQNYCVLLYPGKTATDLSNPTQNALFESQLDHRQLVVILIDATWRDARKIHRLGPSLQRLPRIKFTPTTPSRFVIKKQPRADCLSTLEATHELLLVLARAGLDQYTEPTQLPDVFQRMQDFQIKCARDPMKKGYRRHTCSQTIPDSPTAILAN